MASAWALMSSRCPGSGTRIRACASWASSCARSELSRSGTARSASSHQARDTASQDDSDTSGSASAASPMTSVSPAGRASATALRQVLDGGLDLVCAVLRLRGHDEQPSPLRCG